MSDIRRGSRLERASVRDTLAFLATVAGPTVAKGILIRRPSMVALAAYFALDAGAVRTMQRLRRTYGSGPLLLAIPGRSQAVLLAAEHVNCVLVAEPELFAPATREKRAALAHFEPHGSLISREPERQPRRNFSDEVLESACPVHSMAEIFIESVEAEAARLLSEAGARLDWVEFTQGWHRLARRIVLGDAAADDAELTEMLARLRAAANWAFLHPQRKALRQRFRERLAAHLRAARPGSLAAQIARRGDADVAAPLDQVTQWLFAFDAAGIAAFRALALIVTTPGVLAKVRAESRGPVTNERPFTRACYLESVRLWPTTPAILRETTAPTTWNGGTMPAGTQVLIFVPFFHRDDEHLPQAHRFAPELWLGANAEQGWPLIPFSDGPGRCPAHNLAPLIASLMIGALLKRRELTLQHPERLTRDGRLPGTFDHFKVSFNVTPPLATPP